MQWEIALNVLEIWRYPVKTLAGEKLSRVCLGLLGLEGDRLVHVEDASGRVMTSRSHPRFLGHQGTYDSQGVIRVGGATVGESRGCCNGRGYCGAGCKTGA